MSTTLILHKRRVLFTWTELCVAPANDQDFGPAVPANDEGR